jgi:hypothetical protein
MARLLHFNFTVKGNLCLPTKSQIAQEILAYLAEHPDAQDTLDGIAQWWLLERKIDKQLKIIKQALTSLKKQGRIEEYTSSDLRTVYRLIRK